MQRNLKVVVGQCPADIEGPNARLEWLKEKLGHIRDLKADLLILPELFFTGYNVGGKISERAEEKNSPSLQHVATLAQKYQIAIHFGYAEKRNGALFNSAICYDANGEVVGHHRKLLLPPGFEGEYFDAGVDFTLFEMGGLKIATLICYDAEFPENFRQVVSAGADLVVVPTALGEQWGIVSEKLIPTRAFENGVFVCYANYSGQENGLSYFGGSCIVGPDGKDLARAGRISETIFANLDIAAVKTAQSRLPYHADRAKLPWAKIPKFGVV